MEELTKAWFSKKILRLIFVLLTSLKYRAFEKLPWKILRPKTFRQSLFK